MVLKQSSIVTIIATAAYIITAKPRRPSVSRSIVPNLRIMSSSQVPSEMPSAVPGPSAGMIRTASRPADWTSWCTSDWSLSIPCMPLNSAVLTIASGIRAKSVWKARAAAICRARSSRSCRAPTRARSYQNRAVACQCVSSSRGWVTTRVVHSATSWARVRSMNGASRQAVGAGCWGQGETNSTNPRATVGGPSSWPVTGIHAIGYPARAVWGVCTRL